MAVSRTQPVGHMMLHTLIHLQEVVLIKMSIYVFHGGLTLFSRKDISLQALYRWAQIVRTLVVTHIRRLEEAGWVGFVCESCSHISRLVVGGALGGASALCGEAALAFVA